MDRTVDGSVGTVLTQRGETGVQISSAHVNSLHTSLTSVLGALRERKVDLPNTLASLSSQSVISSFSAQLCFKKMRRGPVKEVSTSDLHMHL